MGDGVELSVWAIVLRLGVLDFVDFDFKDLAFWLRSLRWHWYPWLQLWCCPRPFRHVANAMHDIIGAVLGSVHDLTEPGEPFNRLAVNNNCFFHDVVGFDFLLGGSVDLTVWSNDFAFGVRPVLELASNTTDKRISTETDSSSASSNSNTNVFCYGADFPGHSLHAVFRSYDRFADSAALLRSIDDCFFYNFLGFDFLVAA